jgi:hypothetical protein
VRLTFSLAEVKLLSVYLADVSGSTQNNVGATEMFFLDDECTNSGHCGVEASCSYCKIQMHATTICLTRGLLRTWNRVVSPGGP